MDKDTFTAEDWLNAWRERQNWEADKQVRDKLEELSTQMLEIASAHGIPLLVCFVQAVDDDASNCTTTSNFLPLNRTAPEMLSAFSICTSGMEEGLATTLSLASQTY